MTYNKIIVGEEGALAKRIEDVADLGLDDGNNTHQDKARGPSSSRPRGPGVNETEEEHDNLADFISEISHEEQQQLWNSGFPIITDPFVAYNDFNMCEFDSAINFPMPSGSSDYSQIGYIDDWFSSIHG